MNAKDKNFRLWIAVALVCYILIHVILNKDPVDVFFLFMYIRMPAAFLVLTSAAMGAGALYLFQFIRKGKQKQQEEDPSDA